MGTGSGRSRKSATPPKKFKPTFLQIRNQKYGGKIREWTFWPPLPIRPPIHYGVYLDSLCPFVGGTFNITPLYRRWDLVTFVQKRVFWSFSNFHMQKRLISDSAIFDFFPIYTSTPNPLSPPIGVATRGPYFGSYLPPKWRPSDNFKRP